MRSLVRAILILAALGVVSQAQQPIQRLTLQDCLKLAEGIPNAVTIAERERQIANRDVTVARAGLLPQAEVQSTFIYNSPHLRDRAIQSFIPLNAIREYVLLGSVTQDFDTSGRLRAEMQRARSNQEAAGAARDITLRDLRRAVTTAYYRLLLTRHLGEVRRQALLESRSFEQRVKLLFDKGEAARADVVKASAQAASLEQDLKAAEIEATIANQELASFWTRDVSEALVIVDSLEEPPNAPDPAVSASAYLRRPEFRQLDAFRQGFETDAKIARSALLPQLSFVFQYGIDSTGLRVGDRGYAAYLSLRIPVFDWFKARSQKEQFKLRADQIAGTRVMTERLFSRDYQTATVRVKEYFEQIRLTREQVRLAEEDLRLSRLRYEGGEGLALDVVTSQSQLAQARSNYYTAVANYLNARADLEVASGS